MNETTTSYCLVACDSVPTSIVASSSSNSSFINIFHDIRDHLYDQPSSVAVPWYILIFLTLVILGESYPRIAEVSDSPLGFRLRDLFLDLLLGPVVLALCGLFLMASPQAVALFLIVEAIVIRAMVPSFVSTLKIFVMDADKAQQAAMEDDDPTNDIEGYEKRGCAGRTRVFLGIYGAQQAAVVPYALSFFGTYISLTSGSDSYQYFNFQQLQTIVVACSVVLAMWAMLLVWHDLHKTKKRFQGLHKITLAPKFLGMLAVMFSVSLMPLFFELVLIGYLPGVFEADGETYHFTPHEELLYICGGVTCAINLVVVWVFSKAFNQEQLLV
jgi:hypothetical protein